MFLRKFTNHLKTTRCHDSENHNLNPRRRQNLKPHKVPSCFNIYRVCSATKQKRIFDIYLKLTGNNCDVISARRFATRCSVVLQRVHHSWDVSVEICMIDASQMTPTLQKREREQLRVEQL
jgi:hypothetical protein